MLRGPTSQAALPHRKPVLEPKHVVTEKTALVL
jgi:hypothetical protein